MSNEELVILVQNGQTELLPTLWERSQKLLFSLINKQAAKYNIEARGYTIEDLEQECYIILCEAVNAYNPKKEYKLNTYFELTVKNHLNNIVGNRIKTHGLDLLNGAESLDKPLSDDSEGLTLYDTIANKSNDFEAADEMLFNEQLHNSLEIAINSLEEAQGDCIRLRYYQNLSYAQTGKILNISLDKARWNIENGLKVLRRNTELKKYRAEIISSRAYQGNGYGAFIHYGSTPERLAELSRNYRKEM